MMPAEPVIPGMNRELLPALLAARGLDLAGQQP